MTQIESTDRSPASQTPDERPPHGAIGIACGGLGIAAAVWAFWLVVPGILLGAAAIMLGLWSRHRGAREAGTAAVALGIAAVLLVPSVLMVVASAEDWGRTCALEPANPDC